MRVHDLRLSKEIENIRELYSVTATEAESPTEVCLRVRSGQVASFTPTEGVNLLSLWLATWCNPVTHWKRCIRSVHILFPLHSHNVHIWHSCELGASGVCHEGTEGGGLELTFCLIWERIWNDLFTTWLVGNHRCLSFKAFFTQPVQWQPVAPRVLSVMPTTRKLKSS